MKLTELDRIYFLRSQTHLYPDHRILSDITHLGYMLGGTVLFFCSSLEFGVMPQCCRKVRDADESKCSLRLIAPDKAFLEENDSEAGGVSCPECLEIAIKGEIPEPKPTGKPLIGTTERKS